MQVRRVVTGHSSDGKATLASDSKVAAITAEISPGWEFHRLWGADETSVFPNDGSSPFFSILFSTCGRLQIWHVYCPTNVRDNFREYRL